MAKLKNKLLFIILPILTLFIAIGYTQLTDTLSIAGLANVEAKKGIYISNVTVSSGNAVVVNYVDTVLSSDVTLPDTTSTATLTVTITNNSNTTKVFNAVKYMDEAYSNPDITFTLNGLVSGTAIPSDSPNNTLTFTITFSFAGKDTSNPKLESVLLFEFADAADWDPDIGDDDVTETTTPNTDGSDTPETTPPSSGGSNTPEPEVGEDFFALVMAAISEIRGEYGLNDPHKGSVLVNAIKNDKLVYSTDNMQGGNIKHFASQERNAHNLDFLFEYISDTQYVLYIWRLDEVNEPSTVIGTTEIVVYKQVIHYTNGKWEKTTPMSGHAVIKNLRNNDNIRVNAIVPSEWEIGNPHKTT